MNTATARANAGSARHSLKLAASRTVLCLPLSSTLAIFRRRKRAVPPRARAEAGEIFACLLRSPTAKNLTAARGPDALGPTHRQRSAAPFGTRHSGERLAARPADVGRLRPLTRRGLTAPAWPERWPNHAIGVGRPSRGKGGLPGRWSPWTNAG